MLDCDDSVIGTGGGKKDTQSAVDSKSPQPLPHPKNKQPKPIMCVWNSCPLPHIGQMIVQCSKDGCDATMHEQCF